MKRCPPTRLILRSLILMLFISSAGGCALWNTPNETIIRVQTKFNPLKAERLTLAGVKALQSENVDLATKKFIAAIESDPSYGPAHNNLGLLHYEQGNLYQAVLAFEQAMEYMPSDPVTLYNLGLTLESAGKVEEAKDLYYQAVQMDPVNPVFLGNLVRLMYRLGERGPELTQKLEDLILIETRSNWRQWADGLLAMELNDAFDRGPETPDFDPGGDGDHDPVDFNIEDRIIDLTPSTPTRFDTVPEGTSPYKMEMLESKPRIPNTGFDSQQGTGSSSRRSPRPPATPRFSAPQPLRDNTGRSSRRTTPRQSIRDSAPIELSAPKLSDTPAKESGMGDMNDLSPPDSMTADDLFDSF